MELACGLSNAKDNNRGIRSRCLAAVMNVRRAFGSFVSTKRSDVLLDHSSSIESLDRAGGGVSFALRRPRSHQDPRQEKEVGILSGIPEFDQRKSDDN